VDCHGGKIGIQSEGVPGRGCVFYVHVPLATASSSDLSSSDSPLRQAIPADPSPGFDSSSAAEDSTSPRGVITLPSPAIITSASTATGVEGLGSGRVLVVDDSKLNRKMMAATVKAKFQDIVQAENGRMAVEEYEISLQENRPFDLILMDSIMPVMSGVEATRIIRSRGFQGLIVGVTGNILPEDIAQFKESGVNDVILKPLHLDALEAVLSREQNCSPVRARQLLPSPSL
jgi:CheY-like chemotaxis protein